MKLKTLFKSTTVALLLSAKLVNAQIPAAYGKRCLTPTLRLRASGASPSF